MKASTTHQTAREALMVMREAFRDQAGVGIDPAGELVYVNPDRPTEKPHQEWVTENHRHPQAQLSPAPCQS